MQELGKSVFAAGEWLGSISQLHAQWDASNDSYEQHMCDMRAAQGLIRTKDDKLKHYGWFVPDRSFAASTVAYITNYKHWSVLP
eukprot:2328366-Alexandrium_andersonii.AAC.1